MEATSPPMHPQRGLGRRGARLPMTARPNLHSSIHAALVLVLLLATTPTPIFAANAARRQCLRTCAPEAKSCMALARSRVVALRTACTGSASTCRRTTHAVLRTAKASCRRLRKDCRTCCRAGGTGLKCPVGKAVSFDPPPPQDLEAAHVPRLPNGQFLMLALPGAQLTLDPTLRDPVTALGACTAWITSCVAPAVRSLDDCARSAPPCATDRPWEEATACCPAACFDAYQQARRSGTESLAAYGRVYFREPDCFPGVRALLEGGGS
jgi:hypothetical protein